MSARLKLRWWLVISTVVFLAFINPTSRTEARPKYKGVFEKIYVKGGKEGKLTCAMCHSTDDKKKLNHYSEALAKELGKKNETDEERIKEAFLAIEDGECRSGKWKKRLEKGLFPGVCPPERALTDSYIGRLLERGH